MTIEEKEERKLQKAAKELTKITRQKDFKRGYMENDYYCMEFDNGQVFKVRGKVLDKMIMRIN